MKHIKTFSLFESVQILTPDQKDFLDKHTGGTWSLNPSTGLVDVEGDFDCSHEGLKDFLGVKFGKVSRNFNCSVNLLTSLAGAPQTVGGAFYCTNNMLTSLAGAPKTVGGGFSCSSNNLTSLAGAPQTIGGGFYSNDLIISRGRWSLQTLIEMYRNSLGQEKKLLGTLVTSEALQKRIDANPERAAIELKSIVHLPRYQDLRWPESLKSEVDLLADLDGVGL